jgi:hypothetical protein
MGMMSVLDIARQNGEFQVPDDDDMTPIGETFLIGHPDNEKGTVRLLSWYFSDAGHLRVQRMPMDYDQDDEQAYSGPYVDLPAPFAQQLRALLFDK